MTSACASPSADRPDRPDRPADVAEDTSDASRDDETGAPGTPLPEGCGRPPPASGPATLDHEGLTRTYGLYVPPTYDPNIPTPIVFAFHGWGGQESEYLGHPTVIAEARSTSASVTQSGPASSIRATAQFSPQSSAT